MSTQYNLSKAADLNAALVHLGFKPIATEVLPALSRMDGPKFKKVVADVLEATPLNEQEQSVEAARNKAYLLSITSICSAEVVAGVNRLSLDASPEVLVETARSFPLSKMFRGSFDLAVKGDTGAKNALSMALGEARRNLAGLMAMQEENASVAPEQSQWRPAQERREPSPHPPHDHVPQPEPAPPMQRDPRMGTPAQPAARAASSPQQKHQNTGGGTQAESKRFGPSKHIYGGSGAVCFQVSIPSDDNAKWGIHIEGAKGGNKKYDWDNKTNIRFNDAEIPLFLGVLLGFMPSFEGAAHGPTNNKSFSIENQGAKFFLKVREDKKTVATPMTLGDAWWVTAMFLKVLMHMTGLQENTLIGLVKTNCQQLLQAQNGNNNRNAA